MANAKYESHCNCGYVTGIYRDPDKAGLSFVCGSGDIGKTCICGNGGFVFRLVSKKLRDKFERTEETTHDFTDK